MKRILYAVTATLPDRATADEYVAWLEDGHVDQVMKHGAHTGMIVRLEGEPLRIETQYVFGTRELFDAYVKTYAPVLRAEGLTRFPAERGVRFERRVGEIL